jgi:CRP-like cAMP-binding protein
VLTAADLRGLPLFSQLTDSQADSLLVGQIGVDVAAEQVLLLQQDEGEGLVVIQTGLAKGRAYTANGEEVVRGAGGPPERAHPGS